MITFTHPDVMIVIGLCLVQTDFSSPVEFWIMYFRPYLWLTVFCPVTSCFGYAGSVALDRLVWKTELIDSFNERAMQCYAAADAAAELSQFEFHNLALSGRFMHDRELYLTGRTYEGMPAFMS